MQAANASEQSKPSQPVPVDENTFVAVPSCKPDFVSEDVLPAPVPLVKPPPAPMVKPSPAPMVVPAPVQIVKAGWFETIRQKKKDAWRRL